MSRHVEITGGGPLDGLEIDLPANTVGLLIVTDEGKAMRAMFALDRRGLTSERAEAIVGAAVDCLLSGGVQ